MRKYLLMSLILPLGALFGAEALVEAKAGYFYPTDHKFRKIYSGGGVYGMEVSYEALCNVYAWGSVNYFSQDGRSYQEGPDTVDIDTNRTSIEIVPLGFGLKYLYNSCYGDFYVAAGPLATHMHIKDHSPFVIQRINKWGWGGTVKLGANFDLCDNLYLNVFSDYSYMKMDFHYTDNQRVVRTEADISGISVGAGLGYKF